MRHTTNPLMPPIQERPAQTAMRLRQRLRDLYPNTTFRIQTKRAPDGADVVVAWSGGPTTVDLIPHVAPFQRTSDGPQDATMWMSPQGQVSVIWPGARRVRLQHHPQPA